jgi:hypothetical protein
MMADLQMDLLAFLRLLSSGKTCQTSILITNRRTESQIRQWLQWATERNQHCLHTCQRAVACMDLQNPACIPSDLNAQWGCSSDLIISSTSPCITCKPSMTSNPLLKKRYFRLSSHHAGDFPWPEICVSDGGLSGTVYVIYIVTTYAITEDLQLLAGHNSQQSSCQQQFVM